MRPWLAGLLVALVPAGAAMAQGATSAAPPIIPVAPAAPLFSPALPTPIAPEPPAPPPPALVAPPLAAPPLAAPAVAPSVQTPATPPDPLPPAGPSPAPPTAPPSSPSAALPPAAAVPAPPAPNIWLPRATIALEALDRVTAKRTELTGRVGDTLHYDSLTIVARSCVVRPPDQPADAAAWLDITDAKPGEPGFQGWILAAEPNLSMFQHPLYDIRLVGCP
jgi:hypothetical protein